MLKLTDIIVDDEFCDFMPEVSAEERQELHDSIEKDGFIDPLIVWMNRGILVDGHNRFEEWLMHFRNNPDREPEIIEKEFKDRNEVLDWMYRHQNGRRNWTEAQRVQVALKYKPVLEAKAKENQSQSSGRGKKGSPNLANLNPVDTRKELAAKAGVSQETFRKAETVLKSGDEETKAAMLAPKSDPKRISVSAAHAKVKPKAEPKRDKRTEFDPEKLEAESQASQFDPEAIEGKKTTTQSDTKERAWIDDHAVQIGHDVKALITSLEKLMNRVDSFHAKTPMGNHKAFCSHYQRMHKELSDAATTMIQVERAWRFSGK